MIFRIASDNWQYETGGIRGKVPKRLNRGGSFIRVSFLKLFFAGISVCNPSLLLSQTVAVRHPEGQGHGFLVLRTPEGRTLALGEEIQTVQGDRVKTHMRFRFRDGSIYEETTLFSQSQTFRLLSDHVLQKGPAFKYSMEFD